MSPTVALLSMAPIALAAWISGCNTTPPRPPLTADIAYQEVTVHRLRAMDYEYANRFGQQVSVTAMQIAASTQDAEVRDRAYRWRIWATPQARAAAFDQDPVAGLIELWVLAGQQRAYLSEGGGSQALGEHQALAVDMATRLEDHVRELATSVMKADRFEDISKRIDAWVSTHPIEGWFSVRPTARADLATLVPRRTQGGLSAVGSMEETFRDLNDRLAILTSQLPEEARWQAEYLTHALFEERFQEPTDSIIGAVADITAFLEGFEGTLEEQTDAAIEAVQRERMAVFDAIAEERAMILSAIEQERLTVMTKLDEQLLLASAELDEVGRGLIDHFFVRLIEVLIASGVFVLSTVALVLLVLRRRRSNED